jgi:hypothetical protein
MMKKLLKFNNKNKKFYLKKSKLLIQKRDKKIKKNKMVMIKTNLKKENGLRKKIMNFRTRMKNKMKGKISVILKTKMKVKLLKSNINKKTDIDKIQTIGKIEVEVKEEDKEEIKEENKLEEDLGNKILVIVNNTKETMIKIIRGKEGEISKFIKKKVIEAMSQK